MKILKDVRKAVYLEVITGFDYEEMTGLELYEKIDSARYDIYLNLDRYNIIDISAFVSVYTDTDKIYLHNDLNQALKDLIINSTIDKMLERLEVKQQEKFSIHEIREFFKIKK